MAALAPDGKTPIEPLMNVVSTLFSKEMMYPSIKQLYDAVSTWKESFIGLDAQVNIIQLRRQLAEKRNSLV